MSMQRTTNSSVPTRKTHFADESINHQMASHGFAVLPTTCSSATVAELSNLYEGVVEQVGRDGSGVFLPSMMITHLELRARLWDGVQRILAPICDPLFTPDTTTVIGGSFVSKPGAENSARNPHQDPSVFDEAREVSISLWIPLTDSDASNGTLCLLPGSHLMGNNVRPPDVNSLSAEVSDFALNQSVQVELEAGQILVIDGSVIHHSPANTSSYERVAAICALLPPSKEMRYALSEDGAAEGTARIYEVGVEMYRSGNLVKPELDPSRFVQSSHYQSATLADLQASMNRTA